MIRGFEHPTSEQTFLIAEFFSLSGLGVDYFVELVALSRSTKPHYSEYLKRKLAAIRQAKDKPVEMLPLSRPLSEGEEYAFNSDPTYAAVWLSSMNLERNSMHEIAADIGISLLYLEQIANFLIKSGFCKRESNRLIPLARSLKFSAKSPSLNQFLATWRTLALERISTRGKQDFFQSEPMSISRAAFFKIREAIESDLARYKLIQAEHPSEIVACLNIDLFQISKSKN